MRLLPSVVWEDRCMYYVVLPLEVKSQFPRFESVTSESQGINLTIVSRQIKYKANYYIIWR